MGDTRVLAEIVNEDVPLVDVMYLVFTRMPGGVSYRERFRSLLLCPLPVECCYFPLLVLHRRSKTHSVPHCVV